MPPIVSRKDEDVRLFDLVSSSVVTVHRKKDDIDEFGPGFIAYCDSEHTYICVHPCNVKHGEELTVTFSDDTKERARFLFNIDTHAVLLVNNLTTSSRSQVTFCEGPIRRERIFTIARVEDEEGLGLMTGNMITPDCTALREDGSYVNGSGDLFAISCPAGGFSKQRSRGNASRIVGAAVFNMEGQVIGTIHSIKAFDVKHVMKLSSFLNTLEQALQNQNKKVLISRSQNISGMESSTARDQKSQQRGTTSGSESKKSVLPKGGPLRAASLDHQQQQQLDPHSQVVSVRRNFDSGKLMATAGMLAGNPTGAYPEEAAAEGLLVDSLGNIAGFNCYAKKGSTFMPRDTILEFTDGFQKARAKKRAGADLWCKLNSQCKGKQIKLKARSPSLMSGLEGSSTMEKKQSACHYCDSEGQPGMQSGGNRQVLEEGAANLQSVAMQTQRRSRAELRVEGEAEEVDMDEA